LLNQDVKTNRIRQGPTNHDEIIATVRNDPSSTAKTASRHRNLLQEKRVRQDA
jgi:hypothetical protein